MQAAWTRGRDGTSVKGPRKSGAWQREGEWSGSLPAQQGAATVKDRKEEEEEESSFLLSLSSQRGRLERVINHPVSPDVAG